MNTSRNNTTRREGVNYAPVNSDRASTTNGSSGSKASAAKIRGNKVHSRLKTLCHQWMMKNRPEMVDRLRERARREIRG